jgi:hypothetical protein
MVGMGLHVILKCLAALELFTSVPADFHVNPRVVSSFFAKNIVLHRDSLQWHQSVL